MPKKTIKKAVVAIFLFWTIGFYSLLLIASWREPANRAIVLMALGLLLLWVIGCGSLMWRFGDEIIRLATAIRLDWRVRFVLFATLLALTEEAIATLMTNLAPLLGDVSGQATITASKNYFEVVTRHSVVVFIPMFIGWAVLLSWRNFSPFSVLILFGLTGLLAESISFGAQNFLAAGFWILVYGLMVYLPARAVLPRDIPPASWWQYPLAIIFPILCAAPIALTLLQKGG